LEQEVTYYLCRVNTTNPINLQVPQRLDGVSPTPNVTIPLDLWPPQSSKQPRLYPVDSQILATVQERVC